MKVIVIIKDIVFVIITLLIGCKDNDEHLPTFGYLNVTVKSLASNNPIVKTYVFLNDSLYGKTDANGRYSDDSISPGNYTLTCSAIYFRDTSLMISISGGAKTQLNFTLAADTTFGFVFGEFQDMAVFRQKSIDKPQINTWDEKQVFDGVTGATIYKKGPQNDVPARTVSLDDSIIAVSDAWGQYWFKIQSGTYVIKGACEGYANASQVIILLPGSKIYANICLEKK